MDFRLILNVSYHLGASLFDNQEITIMSQKI